MAMLWIFYGHSMAILWLYYSHGMAMLWIFYGHCMAILLMYYSYGMATLWLRYGYSMAILWPFNCHSMAFVWLYYGYGTAILLTHYGLRMKNELVAHIITHYPIYPRVGDLERMANGHKGPERENERGLHYARSGRGMWTSLDPLHRRKSKVGLLRRPASGAGGFSLKASNAFTPFSRTRAPRIGSQFINHEATNPTSCEPTNKVLWVHTWSSFFSKL